MAIRDNITNAEKKKAKKIIDALTNLKNLRLSHDIVVKECTHFVLPRKSDTRDISTISSYNGGELASYATLFTRAGRGACQKLAGGIFNYMTPKNQKWFKLKTGDAGVDGNEKVYAYFDDLRDIMLNALGKSNFSEIAHEAYLNFGCVGTVCTYPHWDKKENKLIFTDIPYNNFFFTEDDEGRPNRVYRHFVLNAEQAIDKFGKLAMERCKQVWECYTSEKETDKTRQFKFIHLVEPNKHRTEKRILDPLCKKYNSIYVCEEDKVIIPSVCGDGTMSNVHGGFDELPYKIGRFLKYNTEGNVMGYSPAMDCMPLIKSLETLKRKLLLAIEKNVNPPMARGVSMNMTPNKLRTTPNAINNFDSRSPESKPVPIMQSIDLQFGFAELDVMVKEIETAFYIDAFQTITNIDKSNATATEILGREREALATTSPFVSRMEDEWLEPILSYIFKLLYDKGMFPEPPRELPDEFELKLEFTGVLSSAPKLTESTAIMQYFQELAGILEFMPEDRRMDVLNAHDYYEIVKTLQENRNLPARFRVSKEEIEAQAQAQAEAQQQQQQQMQLNEAMAKQNLNEKPQEGSPMSAMLQGGGR